MSAHRTIENPGSTEAVHLAAAPSSATEQVLAATPFAFSPKERSIILQTCCNGASQREADQLIAIAEARGMSPIRGECYFVKRYDSNRGEMIWAVQASIDSFRIKAEETGLYEGQDEPEYEYEETDKTRRQPILARVRIWRRGWPRPIVGVARFSEYVQKKKDGSYTKFWKDMPHNQLAKCAEALGMRKAFPRSFAGIYTTDEMAQAESERPSATTSPHDSETGEVRDEDGPGDIFGMRLASIHACTTFEGLKGIGQALAGDKKAGVVTAQQEDVLRAAWKQRRDRLTAPEMSAPPAEPSGPRTREPGED